MPYLPSMVFFAPSEIPSTGHIQGIEPDVYKNCHTRSDPNTNV